MDQRQHGFSKIYNYACNAIDIFQPREVAIGKLGKCMETLFVM